MFRDLPIEINQTILDFLTPRDQAALLPVDAETYRFINNADNYKRIAANYNLPSFFDSCPLRRLSHYYTVVTTENTAAYWNVIEAGIVSDDVEWMKTHGLRLMYDSCKDLDRTILHIIDFFVRSNLPNLVRDILLIYHDDSYLVDQALGYCVQHSNPRAYEVISTNHDVNPDRYLTRFASRGNEDAVNYLESKHKCDRSAILNAYFYGGHLDLYNKYRQIYNIEHGPGMRVRASLHLDPSPREIDDIPIFYGSTEQEGFLDTFGSALRKPSWIRIDGCFFAFCITEHGNYTVLRDSRRYVQSKKDGELHIELEDFSRIVMLQNYSDFARTVKVTLDFLNRRGQDIRRDLEALCIHNGNLELLMILENL